MKVRVPVAYDSEPKEVQVVLLAAAAADPDVVAEPAPFVWLSEFGAYSLDFDLVCYTARLRGRFSVASRLRHDIRLRLQEAGDRDSAAEAGSEHQGRRGTAGPGIAILGG